MNRNQKLVVGSFYLFVAVALIGAFAFPAHKRGDRALHAFLAIVFFGLPVILLGLALLTIGAGLSAWHDRHKT